LYKKNKILAIILARSGSKRLKNKNIRLLNSKPLIYWTIKAAKQSNLIDDVVVSTDGKKIASICKNLGVSTPFLRPKKIADDKSSSIEAIIHCLNFLEKKGDVYNYCILLEPTSPLRDASDIDSGIKELINNPSAEALVSLAKVGTSHPNYMYRIKKNKKILNFYTKSKKIIRNQDVENLYYLEGSLYISKIITLKTKKTFYHEKTMAKIFPKWKSIEVDDITDIKIAELLLKNKRKFY
jgi:CMP-N,N'-diacetyllegionaminic acid synthase